MYFLFTSDYSCISGKTYLINNIVCLWGEGSVAGREGNVWGRIYIYSFFKKNSNIVNIQLFQVYNRMIQQLYAFHGAYHKCALNPLYLFPPSSCPPPLWQPPVCSLYLSLFGAGWGDTWVAQSVEHLTLDFSSGHDLRVMNEFKPPIGLCAQHEVCMWFSLSLFLGPSPCSSMHVFSL